jgi:predicted DNA-binding protein (MmcQ/YjbR family)
MDIETLRTYCLAKKAVTEGLPFGEDTLVFKVAGKMFALISLSDPSAVNLKCDPEYALELRAEHPEDILPGYHMNKKYWNTVSTRLPGQLLRSLMDHSYDQVLAGLSKRERAAFDSAE